MSNTPFENPCGGCGEKYSDRRCIGCLHEMSSPPQDTPEQGLVERLRLFAEITPEHPSGWSHLNPHAVALVKDAATRIQELEHLVEQAFRDGLAYAANVESPDPDLAWQHSRARALLKDTPR